GRRLVAADASFVLRVWDRETGAVVRRVELGRPSERIEEGIGNPVLTADGRFYADTGHRDVPLARRKNAVGTEDTLRGWAVTEGRQVVRRHGVKRRLHDPDFEGEEAEGMAYAIALSPDGQTLA